MCFAGQKVPWKMDGEALSWDGCGTVPAVPGPWPDQKCSVTTASGFALHKSSFEIWRTSRNKASLSHLQLSVFEEVWSRTKASFPHLQLSVLEGCLAPKLRFYIFNFQVFEASLAPKLRFHIFSFQFWGKSCNKASFNFSLSEGDLARNEFCKVSGCTKCCVLQDQRCLERPREGFGNRFGWGRIMPGLARGVAVASGVVFPTWSAPFLKGISHESSFSHLPLSDLEGKFWKVSHQSFVFASSTFRFCGKVSHQGFVFTSSTFRFWGKTSHQSFVFASSTFSFGGKVSRQSFVFTSSTFTFSGKPRRNVLLRVSGMHEIMCFAEEKVPWKMDGEALSRDGCKTVPAVPGSWSDQNGSVVTASGVVLGNLSFNIWRTSRRKASFLNLPVIFRGKVSKESFLFTSSTFSFWGNVSHERFGFTPSTFRFGGMSFTRNSFSHIQLSVLESISDQSFVFTSSTVRF